MIKARHIAILAAVGIAAGNYSTALGVVVGAVAFILFVRSFKKIVLG